MKINLLLLLFLMGLNGLMAQMPDQVYEVNFQHMLWTVIPFYMITIAALFLFVQKVLRPSFPSKWLYSCTLIGIMGAGIIAYQFDEVRNTQLPKTQVDMRLLRGIPKDKQEEYIQRQQDNTAETLANYWVVAIPNFILLAMGLGLEMNRQRISEDDLNP